MDRENTWPADVLKFLELHSQTFLSWELHTIGRFRQKIDPPAYDRATIGLRSVLNSHLLHGFHCTRLTKEEMQQIERDGMSLPDVSTLHKRICSIQNAGLISPGIASQLREKNQSSEPNRAKKIWFCFYHPRLAGQHGIERFFRSWGGEALYNSHETDPLVGGILRSIGIPCLIEAEIPIISLRTHSYLTDKIARRFLIIRGLVTNESVNHDDYAEFAIPAQNIKRNIRYGDSEFDSLTGCNNWQPPLNLDF